MKKGARRNSKLDDGIPALDLHRKDGCLWQCAAAEQSRHIAAHGPQRIASAAAPALCGQAARRGQRRFGSVRERQFGSMLH